jgi:hypothetical protein
MSPSLAKRIVTFRRKPTLLSSLRARAFFSLATTKGLAA